MAKQVRKLMHAQAIYESELVSLAEGCGWSLVSVKGDHHNFKHPDSRFIVTIVHPSKDVPVGRLADTVKKIRLEVR